MSRLIGSERYCGGWLDRRGGTLQPLAYLFGLTRAVQQLGGRIFVRSAAIRLESVGGQWRVHTPGGQVSAATVVLATNAYADHLVDALRTTVVAVPSFQVATEPLPQALRDSILPQGQAVSDTWHLLRYYRLSAGWPAGAGIARFLRPCACGDLGAPSLPRGAGDLSAAARAYVTNTTGAALVAMTRDHLPHLHEPAPGVLAGLGYNGRGVAMATVMGRLLARRIQGVAVEELGFPITPVRPMRLHRFSQAGVRLAIGYLQLRERWARTTA